MFKKKKKKKKRCFLLISKSKLIVSELVLFRALKKWGEGTMKRS